jgi:hypothetical protein
MMAINEYLPFANNGGANVATQADYSANSGYATGYQAGVATAKYLNKTWRQSSVMTAMLGQFISDRTGLDVMDDGVIASLQTKFATAVSGRLLNVQIFTSSGTYTPTPGMSSVIVEVQGAGGGGGGTQATGATQVSIAGGGGSGSYAKSRFPASTIGASQSITIGAAGVNLAGMPGSAGGGSSFGSLINAPGGSGAGLATPISTSSTAAAIGAGAGAMPTGANLLALPGVIGGVGYMLGSSQFSGAGGGSPFSLGSGGGGPAGSGNAGQPATAPGSGGGGAATGTNDIARPGGLGAAGRIIVWEYA